ATDGEAAFTLGPQQLLIDLPIRVTGLQDNGCCAVYSNHRPWFRPVPVHDGIAYFQEPIERANEVWVGNVFVSDNPNVKLTLVADGQAEGRKPFLEVHNPTDGAIATTLRSPEHAPVFGGMTREVTVPAGDSVRLRGDGR
ncbi:MAG: hypothetical protein COZ57_35310, partial [Armatimonadetes bacterium CG_4_8_14_3_um_filter_66_20]